jgi:hypothetical protein
MAPLMNLKKLMARMLAKMKTKRAGNRQYPYQVISKVIKGRRNVRAAR